MPTNFSIHFGIDAITLTGKNIDNELCIGETFE